MVYEMTKRETDSSDKTPKKDGVAQRYEPTPRECALLLLHVMDTKEKESGRPVTRFRLSEMSMRRLCLRAQISADFTAEVANWLSRAGVTLCFVGPAYIVLRTEVLDSWLRITTKRLSSDLRRVSEGEFNFSELERLMIIPEKNEESD